MEAFVIAQFTDEVLHDLLQRFGISPSDCTPLRGFENLVFNVVHEGKSAIFRVTHGSHRSRPEIEGELDFMIHVAKNGLLTPAIIPSRKGLLVESTGTSPNDFHAVLFAKAPGQPSTKADWGPDFYRKWGKAIGLMHRSAQSYVAPAHMQRDSWDDDDIVVNAAHYLPEGHEIHLRLLEEVLERMNSWSTTPDVYGLIHADLHRNNFFWYKGEITAFDFDDTAYCWFVYDIAVILFSSAFYRREDLSYNEFAAAFLPPFMEGYRTEYDLPVAELDRIEDLVRFREILLVVVLHKKLGPDRFDESALKLLEHINPRILSEKHAFDLPGGLW